MRFSTGFVLAFAGCFVLTASGLFIALTNPGTDIGGLGWIFFFLGVLFTAGNVILRNRLR